MWLTCGNLNTLVPHHSIHMITIQLCFCCCLIFLVVVVVVKSVQLNSCWKVLQLGARRTRLELDFVKILYLIFIDDTYICECRMVGFDDWWQLMLNFERDWNDLGLSGPGWTGLIGLGLGFWQFKSLQLNKSWLSGQMVATDYNCCCGCLHSSCYNNF